MDPETVSHEDWNQGYMPILLAYFRVTCLNDVFLAALETPGMVDHGLSRAEPCVP